MPDPQDQKPKALEQPSLTQLPKQDQPALQKPPEPPAGQGFGPDTKPPTSSQNPPQPPPPPEKKDEVGEPSLISPPSTTPPTPDLSNILTDEPSTEGQQGTPKPEPTKPGVADLSQSPSLSEEPTISPPTAATDENKQPPESEITPPASPPSFEQPPPSEPPALKEEPKVSMPKDEEKKQEPPPPPALPPLPSDQSPPPPPPAQPPQPEDPSLKPPKRGGRFKKILVFFAIILAVLSLGYVVIKVLLPRLQAIKLPGVPGKETTVSYWGLWEPSSVMQEVIDEFNQQHPEIKVEYTQQSHKDYRERLQSALARNEGPDIFRFHNTWVPMLRDSLDPLPSKVMSASTFQQTFYPVAANDLRLGANFVGIPLEIDGLALFYNKKMFASAGKSPPSTWEELRKTALDLTIKDSRGNIQTAGVALGVTNNIDHWPDILALMMLQNGANLNNPTDKLAQDALMFFTIFSRSDNVWDKTLPSSTQAFATEKVAIYFAPSWRIVDLKALNPDLDFGVLPVPQLPNSTITWASYWAEGVSSKSENKDEAWEFLNFLASKETLEKFYQAAVASGRPIGEPYSRVDMVELLQDDPLVGAYIRQAPNAQSWYLSSATHDNGINDRIIKYFEDAVNEIHQNQRPQIVLETAAQGITQVLSQYRVQ